MDTGTRTRTNEAWLRGLREAGSDPGAARDLEGYLRRVLLRRFGPEDVDELVQESFARILQGLGSFRGDSAFTTWAAAVANRVAFTRLRRLSVRAEHHESFDVVREEALAASASGTQSPHDGAERDDLLGALRHAIVARLTERQRVAIMAEMRGIPTVEIAKRLSTNSNALYKLTHDARRKLRTALEELGFDADSVHERARSAPR
jgi:RNA polymerase sigma-70 factor (ECF subfamily)